MSAVASWIWPPERRIFRPKKFMNQRTTGKVQNVKTVRRQSRYTMAPMEPMRMNPSVTSSMVFSTMAPWRALTSFVT